MTKGLEKGEQIHASTDIRFNQPELVPQKSRVEGELLYLAKPSPVTGLSKWQVGIYQSVNKKNKEKGLAAWMQKKLGQIKVEYKVGLHFI